MIILEVKSLVTKDDNYKVEIIEKYTFNEKINLNEYKELFEVLKESGYVKAHSFDDIRWYLPCPTTFKHIPFSFDVGRHSSFSSSLKSYVLLRRKSGKMPKTIKTDLRVLQKVIKSTNGLQDSKSVKEYFLQPLPEEEIYDTCHTLANYLTFYSIPKIRETVEEILEGLGRPSMNNRDLPRFNDVLSFDECINKYFANHSLEETIRFYPIFLWWVITNLIPMRPIDFLRIKSVCLPPVKDDGSYWIIIPRHKKKTSSLDESYFDQTLQIDKKTYLLIREFQLRLELLGIKSEYLIPPINKLNPRLKAPLTVSRDVPTEHQLRNLLVFFYEEIVENQFGEFHLERITSGDTRHFAIINLFLQGFNILSISRLAGHEEIRTPSNYYTHAEHFAKSAVYKFAQRRLEGKIGSTMKDGLIGRTDNQVRRAISNVVDENDTKKWRKVDYGFCKDTDYFPNNCVEDCRLCVQYYEFKPSVNDLKEGIEWLESFSKEMAQNAINTLHLMAMVSTNSYEKLKGIEKLNEIESKSLSVQFFKYLDHKAIIDARLLEEKLEERDQYEEG
jgi:hypothetical protein